MNVNHPLTVFSFRSSKLGALFREESFSAAIRPGSSSESEAKLSAVESRFKSCLAIAFSSGTSAVAIVVAAVTTDRGSVPWDTSTMSPSGRCSSMHTDVANKGGEPTTSSIAITAVRRYCAHFSWGNHCRHSPTCNSLLWGSRRTNYDLLAQDW